MRIYFWKRVRKGIRRVRKVRGLSIQCARGLIEFEYDNSGSRLSVL